jgi:FAD/FMN-containing dehydrogenase
MLTDTLKSIVGDGAWTTDPVALEPHLTEWRDSWIGKTPIMVSPGCANDVAAVVAACRDAGTAIVPQGGNTGLCGGAIPDAAGDQVLLSLSRMNRIRSVSADDHSIVVEAGCTLASVQEAAAEVDRFFPLSLAAEGSCQIGGNLSTNAGGINVLRYGTARQQALGLEVVLADGTTWNGLRSLRKDTAGYDLKQLFIGSEGTLGIITAASLRLYPALTNARTAIVAIQSPGDATTLLSQMRRELSDQVQAFELIPERAIRYVLRHIPSSRFPLENSAPWYVLVEATAGQDDDSLEQCLAAAMDASLVIDAVIAKNRGEADELWRVRHAISESQKREGASLKHDVSVPVGSVADFIREAQAEVEKHLPGIRVVAFGHVGDGNIHFNLSQPRDMGGEEFLAKRAALATVVYDVVEQFAGSISAEHGIGQAKIDDLLRYKSETEITLMRTVKVALDPQGLLNPGKVI